MEICSLDFEIACVQMEILNFSWRQMKGQGITYNYKDLLKFQGNLDIYLVPKCPRD